ncbi:CAP domain-containing protein [Oscillibacter sp.]|uniref:CAP domain-containing protein n=1 Tax=Oscillibacter sp. TaxID=1945593 RepID=UPI003FA70E8A
MLAGGFLTAALLAGPALAADPEIRVGSYKGNTLEAGERSCLIIGPAGAEYQASSSAPEVITLERVLTYWVAVAKAEGSAEIIVTNEAGSTGSLTLTVGAAEPSSVPSETLDLSANLDIRLEMVRLINEVRRENGLSELPMDESLMNAAQDVSGQCVKEHRPYDHMALIRYGWPYGGLYNLTVFTAYGCPDIARQAVDYWIASPRHYKTMLLEEASHVGTGVTFKNGKAYCYMVVGDPTGHNPYE